MIAIVPSSSSDLQPHDQPIIDEPITNGTMQEVVQLSDIEQLSENVTHAEKHTPDEKEHLHLRIHHDVLNPIDPSRCSEPTTRHGVLIIPSPFLIKTRLLAVNSISMRCFDKYFVCKISDVGFCGMLAKSQCFL